ncbi:MAG: hypothetical protein QOI89_2372 [Solirubrobacteraceae bacterium]|jgi:hypothetical protein|nr:hypothetical protein [Solirubrobacteraceae bacterium]
MLRRIVLVLVGFASLVVLPATASAESCPNEQLRVEDNSTGLPDCRAYEMVSPPQKNGNDISAQSGGISPTRATPTGGGVMYVSNGAFADAAQSYSSFLNYIASREPGGWVTHTALPPTSPPGFVFETSAVQGISSDLSREVLADADPPLVAGAQPHTVNLYLRHNDAGTYDLLTPTGPDTVRNYQPTFAGASAHFSHIVFESEFPLTPGAPPNVNNIYEWTAGQLKLVDVLPGGTPAAGGGAVGPQSPENLFPAGARGQSYIQHAVSSDGSRIIWTDEATGQLYMRVDATTTVQISASKRTTPDPQGTRPALFLDATPDASKVFFKSTEMLTDNATSGTSVPPTPDLYEYDVNTNVLTDLSVDSHSGESAGVEGMLGSSSDGAYVYFAAAGRLAEGGVQLEIGNKTQNLYVSHEGEVRWLGVVADAANWQVNYGLGGRGKPSRVSADGRFLLLTSKLPLTGYDTAGYSQFYLYDAQTRVMTCVSCNPMASHSSAEASSEVPINLGPTMAALYNRTLSADADRVFFDTPEALVPQDTNGKMDVYEWQGGEVHLISSGKSRDDAFFAEASENGDNAFFLTRESLVGQDTDTNMDLYDARVAGGFPAPTIPTTCSGDECQGGVSSQPSLPSPSSASVFGNGNLTPPVPKPLAAHKPLTRAQKLANALKTCRKKPKKRRRACESQAKRKYGRTSKGHKSTSATRRTK